MISWRRCEQDAAPGSSPPEAVVEAAVLHLTPKLDQRALEGFRSCEESDNRHRVQREQGENRQTAQNYEVTAARGNPATRRIETSAEGISILIALSRYAWLRLEPCQRAMSDVRGLVGSEPLTMLGYFWLGKRMGSGLSEKPVDLAEQGLR